MIGYSKGKNLYSPHGTALFRSSPPSHKQQGSKTIEQGAQWSSVLPLMLLYALRHLPPLPNSQGKWLRLREHADHEYMRVDFPCLDL